MNKILTYFVLGLILLIIFSNMFQTKTTTCKKKKEIRKEEQSCQAQTCGAIDPVSDPSYNMKNVVKQTILLEEHLAEKNKYCIDCIFKHFIHCQGLLEEAIWLAGNNVDNYPHLIETDNLYKTLLDTWSTNKHNDKIRLSILTQLRDMRKKLVVSYYL